MKKYIKIFIKGRAGVIYNNKESQSLGLAFINFKKCFLYSNCKLPLNYNYKNFKCNNVIKAY